MDNLNDKRLNTLASLVKTMVNGKNEQDEIFLFISQNADQFFEISERMVSEVKKIKDRHPNSWKEMVAMTMFSTL